MKRKWVMLLVWLVAWAMGSMLGLWQGWRIAARGINEQCSMYGHSDITGIDMLCIPRQLVDSRDAT